MTIAYYRYSERFFNSPSGISAPIKSSAFDSESFRPFDSWKCFASNRHKVCSILIASLFSSCRPSNISRFVVAMSIGPSVKRMFWTWAMPNVGQKRFKRTPPVADRYSLCAVPFKRLVVRIETSLKHLIPTFVLWRLLRSRGAAVSRAACNDILSSQTSTRTVTSRRKVVRMSSYFSSAIAYARHPIVAVRCFKSGYYDQSAESKTHKFYGRRSHCDIIS